MSIVNLTRQELQEKFREAGSLGISLNLVADKLEIEDINKFLEENYFCFAEYRKAQANRIEEINGILIKNIIEGDVKAVNISRAIKALKEHTNLYNFIEEEDLENFRPRNSEAIDEIYRRAMQRLREDEEEKENSID
jgi:heme oxygenase